MKIKLQFSEYIFFCRLINTVVENSVPDNIMSLAGLSILSQVNDRLQIPRPSARKKRYLITLKDYEAIFVYKYFSGLHSSYKNDPFESNVLRQVNWAIHQTVITPYM